MNSVMLPTRECTNHVIGYIHVAVIIAHFKCFFLNVLLFYSLIFVVKSFYSPWWSSGEILSLYTFIT